MKKTLIILLGALSSTWNIQADDEQIAREIRWLDFDLWFARQQARQQLENQEYWEQIERQQREHQRKLDRWRDELLEDF